MVKLRRGFRKEAEEYAAEYREELDLANHDPLDPVGLAEHLLVPVHALSKHPTIPCDIKSHYARVGNSRFSASTLVDGTYREIIHNDYQAPNRQRSNIMHELSHIILGHHDGHHHRHRHGHHHGGAGRIVRNPLTWPKF